MELLLGDDKLISYTRMQERVSGFLKRLIPQSELEIFGRILNLDIRHFSESEIQSSVYVVHTLEAVLWCFLNQNNYSSAVLTGVNLGEDTDTIGALIGGLAGITYNDIPTKWVDLLVKKKEILSLIDVFIKTLKN
jgi:ADP-ribosylglycohydrolase